MKRDLKKVDPAFSSVISAFTSGPISKESTIKIRFIEAYKGSIDFDKPISEKLFRFKPKIDGKAYWIDNRTIEFVPDESLNIEEGGIEIQPTGEGIPLKEIKTHLVALQNFLVEVNATYGQNVGLHMHVSFRKKLNPLPHPDQQSASLASLPSLIISRSRPPGVYPKVCLSTWKPLLQHHPRQPLP